MWKFLKEVEGDLLWFAGGCQGDRGKTGDDLRVEVSEGDGGRREG